MNINLDDYIDSTSNYIYYKTILKKLLFLYYIILGIIVCVAIYFLKDLSVALGEIGKLPILISIWVPIIATGLFCSIGILQINEK